MYYKNGFPSSYDELVSHYPIFYRDVFEMDEILKVYGRLGDEIIGNIDLVINNSFILTADEATITRLEEFLWLETDKTRPLDERRRLIFSFFVGFGKMSEQKIKDMIAAFTDAPATVTFEPGDEFGNNFLIITIERGDVPQLRFSDINTILMRRIPAHLEYRLHVAYRVSTVIRTQRTHYHYEYKLCGTKPEIAKLGDINSTTSRVNSDSVAVWHEFPLCGTMDTKS